MLCAQDRYFQLWGPFRACLVLLRKQTRNTDKDKLCVGLLGAPEDKFDKKDVVPYSGETNLWARHRTWQREAPLSEFQCALPNSDLLVKFHEPSESLSFWVNWARLYLLKKVQPLILHFTYPRALRHYRSTITPLFQFSPSLCHSITNVSGTEISSHKARNNKKTNATIATRRIRVANTYKKQL